MKPLRCLLSFALATLGIVKPLGWIAKGVHSSDATPRDGYALKWLVMLVLGICMCTGPALAQSLSEVEQLQQLTSSDFTFDDSFGSAVDISGGYAIVGARLEDHNADGQNELSDAGAAYIFEVANDGSWAQVQKLVAPDRESGDQFGYSVAINGNYAVVGAYLHDLDVDGANQVSNAGAVYVYKRASDGTWSLHQKLVPSERNSNDTFGLSVAIDGDFLLAGANGYDSGGLDNVGAAYVFELVNDSWTEKGQLLASVPNEGDRFGTSVGLSGEYAVVGAHEANIIDAQNFTWDNAGAAYIFERQSDGSWAEVERITSGEANGSELFGFSVAIDGDLIVVGARDDSEDADGERKLLNAGSAFIFERNSVGSWEKVQKIISQTRSVFAQFGWATDIFGEIIVIGEPRVGGDSGGVYVFERGNDQLWSQSSRSLGNASEYLGIDVAISAEDLIIGTDPNQAPGGTMSVNSSAYIFGNACPDGFTCLRENRTLCSEEELTTLSGQIINSAGTFYDTLNSVITRYDVIVDEDINCCPDGFTCNIISVTECANAVYTSPLGNTLRETGTLVDIDTDNSIRNTYNVTFDRAEPIVDVFQDAKIATTGSVTYQANTNATGILEFNNSEDRWVDLNALQDDLNGTSRSVFMWIKSEDNVSSRNQILFGINQATNGNTIQHLFIDDSNDNLETNDGGTNRSGSFDVRSAWHYVGYTYDATTNQTIIYANGNIQATYTNNQLTTADSRYSLGQEFDGLTTESNHYNGLMAEVSVWDEVLTGAEVREAMKAKITNTHTAFDHLVGYYSVFGECNEDNTQLTDHSGKGNHGIMKAFTVDFQRTENIPGFNAIGWYDVFSWQKDGVEVSTAATYTTDVAVGDYQFIASRPNIQSTDVWSMVLNDNAVEIDTLKNEVLCSDDAIERSVVTTAVNFMDFEENDDTGIEINAVAEALIGTDRSAFMWVKKESSVGSSENFALISFHGFDAEEETSRLYIRSDERLNMWDGDNRLATSTSLSNDTWYHVGYTYDATTFEVKLYVDGNLLATGTREMPIAAGHFGLLGSAYIDEGRDHFFDGQMAEVTIWDKVLTEEEVNELMTAAPAHDAANLVAAYGTIKGISDNYLRDLTTNGNDGQLFENTILVDTVEAVLAGYDASANYTFSWKKGETEFDTDATGNISIDEGTTVYSVTFGTPLFQKTDAFELSYTNLLPMQPVAQTAGVTGSVTFEVEEIPGASYQWFKRATGFTEAARGENGLEFTNFVYDVFEVNGVIYVAAVGSGGLFISRDNGENWETYDLHSLDENATTSVGQGVSIAGDRDRVFVNTTTALFVTEDDGENFRLVTTARDLFNSVSAFIFDSHMEGSTLYMAGNLGLAVSTDFGQNWDLISNATIGNSSPTFHLFVEGSEIYMATAGNGLFVSTDGGSSWQQFDTNNGMLSNELTAVYKNSSQIYVGSEDGLSISSDNGQTWTNPSHFSNIDVLKITEGNGNIYVGTKARGLSTSTDNGVTWTRETVAFTLASGGTSAGEVRAIYANGDQLYLGTSAGVKATNNKRKLTDNTDDTAINQIQGATTHQLTINNLSLDENAAEYFVEITLGDCSETSDDVTLTVLDVPVVSTFSPENGSIDIAIDTELSMTFSREVTKGTGDLKIFDYATDALVQTFTADDLTIDGSTVSITSGVLLDFALQYYITLDAGLVLDAANAGNLAYTDKDVWSFHTICEPLVLTEPEDQTGFVLGSASFSVPEVSGASYQWFKKGSDSFTTLNDFGEGNALGEFNLLRSFVVDGDNLYVATSQRGVLISKDAGQTWTRTESGQNGFASSNGVRDLAKAGNKIFAATTAGLSVSEDEGATWTTFTATQIGLSPGADQLNAVFATSDMIIVGTAASGALEDSNRLAISTDGGQNWTTVSRNQNGFSATINISSIYAIGNNIYVANAGFSQGNTGGLSISNDGGASWTTTAPEANGFANTTEVQDVFVADGVIYAGTSEGLSISTDGGQNWSTTNPTANDLTAREVEAVFAHDGTIYASGGNNLFISTDNAASWTINTPENSGSIKKIRRDQGTLYLGDTFLGLAILNSSESLGDTGDVNAENRISGVDTRELIINNLTEDFDQTEYFVIVTKGICEETSETATLTVTCEPLVLTQPEDQSAVEGGSATFSVPEVAGASYQWFIKELDFELTDNNSGVNFPGAASSVFATNDNTRYAATSSGLAILDPGATNWRLIDDTNGLPTNRLNQVHVSATGTIYLGTSNSGVLVLEQGETVWTSYNTTTVTNFTDDEIVGLFVSDDETIYASTDGGVMVLEKGDTDWTILNSSTTSNGIGTAKIEQTHKSDIGDLFVGTQAGLYVLKADATNWVRYSTITAGGFPSNVIQGLASSSDGTAYAATVSGGVAVLAPGADTWTVYDTDNGFPDNNVKSVFVSESGIVYAAARNGSVAILEPGDTEWEVIDTEDYGGTLSTVANSVFTRDDQEILVGTSRGFLELQTGTSLSNVSDESAENRITGATTASLTISNFTLDFDQTQYFVRVTKGSCIEGSELATLSLQVAPPIFTSLTPADDATEVPRFTDIEITFDKAISKGTGNIEVRRASDDQVLTTIGANSVLVSITDNTASLRLGDTRFEFGTEYYILMPEGAFIGASGEEVAAISDKTEWSFTIIDAPAIVSSTPADDALDVETDINEQGIENAFSFVFNQDMEFGIGGSFDLYKAEGDELVGTTINSSFTNFSIQIADDNRTVQMFFVDPNTNAFDTEQAPPIALEPNTDYYILTSGIPFFDFSITDQTEWNFTTAQPELLVSSLLPEDDATLLDPDNLNATLPTTGTFNITFDQPIAFNNTEARFELYTAADDQLVAAQTLASTISGPAVGDFNSLGFSFASYEFEQSTEYYILVDAGMVKSTETEKLFAGITDKTTWSFTTAGAPFTYIAQLPSASDGSNIDVPVDLSRPLAGFFPGHLLALSGTTEYTAGDAGKVGLYTAADDVLVYEIDLSTDPIVFNPSDPQSLGKISVFAGEFPDPIVVITDDVQLNGNTEYYWLIDEGILINTEGGRFVGISDKTEWAFTTEDVQTEVLELESFAPVTDEPLDLGFDGITLRFAEETEIAAGTGSLTIFKGSDDSVFEVLNISDFNIRNSGRPNTASASVSNAYELGETYYINYPEGFIKSLDGAKSVAAVTDKTTWSYGTGPLADAIFESFYPAPGSSNYDVSSRDDFDIFLSEDVTEDEMEPVGAIRIYKASDNSLFKIIEFDGENDGDLDYPGEGDEINLEFSRNELEPDTEYYVLIDDGFIVSYNEPRYHKGISDPNTWRFTTAALPTEPLLVSSNPANGATDTSVSSDIVLNFSENVMPGFFGEMQLPTNVILYDAADQEVERFATNTLNISGGMVTINPSADLSPMQTYYILIEEGAFRSSLGEDFAGITDVNALRFTTGATPNTAPVASAQDYTGALEVRQELTGTYTYTDADTDPETNSVYQWFMADDAMGNNAAPIDGANTQNFTLTTAEEGKFLALAITPFDGEDAGMQVFTEYKGPVLPPVIPMVVSTLPADNATEVDKTADLSFVLSEAVTPGTGSIRVTPNTGEAVFFDVNSAEVTVSGTDVTINPTTDLDGGTFYTITFDAAVFVDADGNNSAGLTSETAWNFTTQEENVAPEAQGVSITQSTVVDEELQGSYTFFDANEDAESGTTFKWYRADDDMGTGKVAIAGATMQSYTVVNDDDGKFISFEVTPSDGSLTGDPVESAVFGPVLINDGTTNIPPAFTSDAVTNVLDNVAYSYTVTFEDLNDTDMPVLTKTTGPDWLTLTGSVLGGTAGADNIGEHAVVLTLDDQNGGVSTQEFTVTVLASNVAPTVNSVEVAGTTTIDEQLTGSYNFLDDDGDADNSSYQWFRADDAQGTGKTAIVGATNTTYTLTADDAAKFISFEVTPNDGTVDGTADESSAVGAVAKKVPTLTLAAIIKEYGDADFDLTANTNSSGDVTYAFDNDMTGANLNEATVTLGVPGTINVEVTLAETADFEGRIINSSITVSPKLIQFTADDVSKLIGENDPELTFSVTTGAVIGSDEVVTISRDAGETAGTYNISFNEGADADNYDISTVDATFSITQTALTITADAATKTYGEVDPEFTFTITEGELAAGDELNGIISREEGEDVGTYALESSLFNEKYIITFVPASLTIGKADLGITVDDQSRNFGEANPEFTLSFDGLTNGDEASDFDTPPIASTTATEASAPGTYDITLNTPEDANYNITGTTNGTLTVNAVDIALSIADVTVNEDDGDITVNVVLDNAVSGGFTVDVTTADGTATAGTDYTAVTAQTLTFAGDAGETQSFTITPMADFDQESDETLTVFLSNLAGTVLPIDITDGAMVTLANDDVDANLFIITFETTSDNEAVNLPTFGSGYNYGIDWGDGTIDFGVTGDKEHTYATAGTYTVRVTGDFPRIYFKGDESDASDDNALKLKSIEQWGTNSWISMNGAFEGASNMLINATDVPDLSAVFNMEEMFSDCDALTDNDFSAWNVSRVTNMKEMFERADNFNGNISNWDVSNVTNMEQMFKNAISFNGDITGWNTANVENMSEMFRKSTSAPSGTEMAFNRDIDGWDVSSVTDFSRMFEDNNVFNQHLNSWDVSSAEDMSFMFRRTDAFNGNISDWDVSSVTNMRNMFGNALVFDQDISGWDVSAVERMDEMFDGAAQFNANIRNWDVSSVENMEQMFEDTENFNADISIWQTSSLTNMEGMFLRAKAFNQDISGWDISGITSLNETFEEADAFNQDLSGWNTSAITNMKSLFEGADAFNQDISGWNVSAVTNMDSLFFNAVAFDQSLANWNVGSATDMGDMLSGTALSIANYDATLTGWAAQTVQSGVTLGAKGLEYCASTADRQSLIDNEGWTFDGDSQGCETVLTFTDTGGVEDDGDIVVTVTSSNTIIGGFTVDVNTADGTATAGSDYTALTSETLTFAGTAGEEQTFIITPTADSDAEPNETITVSMDNLVVGAGNTVDITDQGTVTIFNEDVAEAFFTTIWETSSDNESITISTEGEGYNYRIDWGDGTIEKNQTGTITHSYTTAGQHTVKIVGSFPRIKLGDSESNARKLKSVEQWGTIEWASMESAFANTQDLMIKTGSVPDLSKVTSMASMFFNAAGFNSDISGWDVGNVTDFTTMFSSTDAFNQDISSWDMSAATTLRGMFSETNGFNQDISAWDVSNVENMFTTFQNANVFDQPLDGWDVSKVNNMSRMFNGADIFDQDLNSWETGNVENFKEMFRNATAFDGNIGNWDVSAGTDFEAMFEDAHAFNQDIGSWDLAKAEALNAMFRDARAFDQDISAWRFPSANETERMFYEAAAFNQDISSWEMGRITDISSMFESATAFDQDISGWDVSNVDDFSWTFGRASAFNQDISAWDVSKGTNFTSMFREVAAFDQDLSDWDVTAATSMSSMFDNAGLSVANYDAILTAWARQNVQQGVELGVEGLQYCAGSNGRQTLIDIKGWTIQNDGINCITIVTIEDVMAAEDDGDITVRLVSSGFVADGFTVDVNTTDGTATAGEDYTAVTSETVTFFGAAGETQVFTITPVADINEEADETLTVSMDNVVTDANNTVTATDIGTVTIQNDDAAAFTFTINTQFRINREITVFKVKEGLTYDYNIDWGDGNLERGQSGNGVHTYTSAGPFTVKITGDFPGFEMEYFGLETVEAWGDQAWQDLESAFFRRTVTINAADVPDLSAGPSMANMFNSANMGTPDLTAWDVSTITNMAGLFNSSDFDGDVSNWNVANVTDMSGTFGSSPFNGDISNWNVGNVTTMRGMFGSNSAFDGDISNWDVSQVTNTESMFNNADAFNTDISSWNVSAVTDMTSMFAETDLFNQDISDWDVSNVTDMAAMFSGSKAFNQPLDDWDVSSVTTMEIMFRNADAFNQDLNSWDVSKVEKFDEMFKQTALFNGDITAWDVSAGQDFEEMFQETEAFNQPIGNWDLASATRVRRMFRDAEVFNQPINDWRFPNLESLEQMFWGALVFNQDLNDWDVSNITDMASTFEEAEAFNGNISNWDVSKVEDFDEFMNDTPFNQDISGWNVSSAIDFGRMFEGSPNFNQDLSNWDMSKAEDVAYMFEEATSFDQDISSWQLTSVTSFDAMLKLSGMSIANYDAFLMTLAQQDVVDDVYFDAEGLQYCAGKAARQQLIDEQGWDFQNDAQSCTATVTIADVMGNEDDGDITVTLTSDAFVADGFTVEVSTADGTATAGTDYTAVTAQTITFAGTVGETQTFTITPKTDTDVEGNETLTISMANLVTGAENTVTITDEATVTIVGDDQPVISFSSAAASNSESVTSSDIEVRLDQAGLSTIMVDYTVSGTATGSGTDYTLASGTLNFTAGDVNEAINLAIIDDDMVEADETVIITLSNAQGASIGTNSVLTYTIEDDDEATVSLTAITVSEGDGTATITTMLDNAVEGGFTVDLITAESSAIRGVDYTGLDDVTLTFAGTAGETQSTTISLIDDEIIEFSESISVLFDNLANTSLEVSTGDVVEVTITDNDEATVTITDVSQVEDGGSFTVTATLDKAVVGGFTVAVSTADGTATTADGDYTTIAGQTLTFSGTAGETQSFDVVPGVDTKLEANESLTVSMSNLAGTTLPVTITDEATLTIINDDAAALTIADASGNEGDGPITLSATLDNAVQGGFSVAVNTTDGTATVADNDYTAITGQVLTFAGTARETQSFTVSPVNDLVIEGDETLAVSLTNLSTALAVDISDDATVTLVNDDFNNAPTDISLSASSIAENNALDATVGNLSTTDLDAGDTHTYSLVAGNGDTDNASFTIDGADLKVNNTSFNFEDQESYSIRLQTDDGNGGTFAKEFTISITNVNETPFSISLSNNTIDEADEAQQVGVLMTLDPDAGDSFTYALVDGNGSTDNAEFTISGSTLNTAGAINFEEGDSRSIRVQVTDAGGLSFEQEFVITIEDVVAEPVRNFTTNVPGGDVKNVFSPNGDGVNETWVIEDLLDNPFNEVRVFAQGGRLLYSQTNYQNDWDGTFKGDPIPDGTYYYEITVFENGQSTVPARVIKGFLTIIRTR